MIGVFRGEKLEPLAVEPHPIEVAEVGIPAGLAPHPGEVHGPGPLIHPEHTEHVPGSAGDPSFEIAARQIVPVEVAPVVALRVPEHLVEAPEHPPVAGIEARLEKGGNPFGKQIAHHAVRCVRDVHLLQLVIPGGGHEHQPVSLRAPFHIGELPVAQDMVAGGGPVGVGRHLEPDHPGRRAAQVDHHPMDHLDHAVARERVLPRLQGGVMDLGLDDVHLAHRALVLLERRDLPGVGRPEQDRAVAAGPARVVGRVAEIPDAVAGEPGLPPARDVAHPQIELADECDLLSIRRDHPVPARLRRDAHTGTGVFHRVAGPALPGRIEGDAPFVGGEAELRQGESQGIERGPGRLTEPSRQPRLIEGPDPGAPRGIHQQKLDPAGGDDPVPELAGGEPGRTHPAMQDQRVNIVSQKLLGAGVVFRGELRTGLGPGDHRSEHHDGERTEHAHELDPSAGRGVNSKPWHGYSEWCRPAQPPRCFQYRAKPVQHASAPGPDPDRYRSGSCPLARWRTHLRSQSTNATRRSASVPGSPRASLA